MVIVWDARWIPVLFQAYCLGFRLTQNAVYIYVLTCCLKEPVLQEITGEQQVCATYQSLGIEAAWFAKTPFAQYQCSNFVETVTFCLQVFKYL